MKSLIFSLIAIFAITFSLEAQRPQRGGGDPAEMAKKQTERMKADLGLNEDQATKVEAVNLAFAKSQQELFKNAGGDRDGMRDKMKAARDTRNTELKKVLSEEQYAKFVAKEKEMRQRRGQGQKNGQGQGRR